MSPSPHHLLRVQGMRGAVQFDVTLDLTAPWTVIFGPSGSGKSTLLRAACGLSTGLDVAFRRGQTDLTGLPPHRRELAYAPQGGAVFPHLSVRQNIEFGQQGHGRPNRHFVDEAIQLFSLGPMLGRRPDQLSGGERQRVSLARAFAVPDPRLLLLDEPFNGLGRRERDTLLLPMKTCLRTRGMPVVSVTHDVEEAFLLDAEVVRLTDGRVTRRGSTSEVLHEEREAILQNLKG